MPGEDLESTNFGGGNTRCKTIEKDQFKGQENCRQSPGFGYHLPSSNPLKSWTRQFPDIFRWFSGITQEEFIRERQFVRTT